MAMKGAVFDLIKTAGQNESGQNSSIASPAESDSETSTVIEASSNSQDKEEMEEAQEGLGTLQTIRPSNGSSSYQSRKPRTGSMATLRRASAASFKGPRGKLHDEEANPSKTRQAKEHSEQGKVKWSGM
jgi:hypothetical protein